MPRRPIRVYWPKRSREIVDAANRTGDRRMESMIVAGREVEGRKRTPLVDLRLMRVAQQLRDRIAPSFDLKQGARIDSPGLAPSAIAGGDTRLRESPSIVRAPFRSDRTKKL